MDDGGDFGVPVAFPDDWVSGGWVGVGCLCCSCWGLEGEGGKEGEMYHPFMAPVTCSRFGRARSSCLGAGGRKAASLETLMMRTRSLELLDAAVDSRIGSRVLVSRKGARWLVCHWVSKPSEVSLKGTAMICSEGGLSVDANFSWLVEALG